MNSLKDRLLNILLYPAGFFERLTDNRTTLYSGIVMVGAVDLLLPDVAAVLKHLFTGKPVNDVYINCFLVILVIIVLGIIDVTFVCVPLFDFFKFMKKKEGSIYVQEHGREYEQIVTPAASRIKTMKVYIMSHFVIIPVSTIVYYAFLRNIAENSPIWMKNLALVIFMLILLWSAAIMSRGINTLFRFNPIFARLTFIAVFAWNFLFGMVFDMQIMNWLMKLFR